MPSVAVIGTRGYPSFYGGFETAVRKLAPYLADHGWDVTVYGRRGATRPTQDCPDNRIATRISRGVETRSLSTLSYGLTATFDAGIRRPDVALIMNVANGFFLPILRARNIPTLVNVDGIEWQRAKWNALAKRVFYTGAQCTARWATGLVFDSIAIERYWADEFRSTGVFIPYGGEDPGPLPVPRDLSHRGYVLMVARFVPENTIEQFFRAIPSIAARHPVILVGNTGYGGQFDEQAEDLTRRFESVHWLGHVSDDALLNALWQHAGVYFHGHTVGGTNPALVQAMASGAPIVARDTVYNREVLGQSGTFVSDSPDDIANTIRSFMDRPIDRDLAGQMNADRARTHYSWQDVCRDYANALHGILP